ncbi:hypothetical protein [Ideonella sp.]|uniref:hypothetical protein n=1 Tax=Ideonella sp. TaxID=1929293 RepID=UPI0035B1AE04
MTTLEDLLLAEQSRCRQLAREYAELGSAAAFARALLDDCLRGADEARHSHDAAAMQAALERLQRFQTLNQLAILVSRGLPSAASLARNLPAARAPMPPMRPQEQFFTWTRALA